MNKIKKGDTVVVIAGGSKNSQGKVIAVDGNKVTVEGVNMVTKHQKPSAGNPNGGIVNVEAPIDISNVMLLAGGKATKVGIKITKDENGKVVKKERFAKKTGNVIK